jgi:glycosyltransferase involved in cell wall biosynthesis
MLNLPKISIVTPSYNQGEFLERCIDSILCQNYPNLEYIIMDGGSSDNSAEIIKRYEKYLAYWQSRPDGGHYSAVQEGFNFATGDIMGWLNSDDMFHPNGLFVVGNTFAQNTEVELITGKRVGFDAEGNLLSYAYEKQTWCRDRLLDETFVDRNIFVMQEATFWRRRLWEQAGATLALSFDLAADFELWLRFSRYARMYTVDALLAGYRYHGASQRSQLGREEYIAQCKRAIVRDRQICSEIPQYDAVPAPLIECRQSKTSLQMLVTVPLPSDAS